MGGDHAPDAILAGALDAIELLGEDNTLVLVGDEPVIRAGIEARGLSADDPRLEIVPSSDDIAMADSPVDSIRSKPDSSIVKLAWLGGRKSGPDQHCEVIISAGNTGACVAAAQMSMRRLPAVHRPGIAVVVPTFFGPIVLCDVGANPEPKPMHLHQYGLMGRVYAQKVLGIDNPRVALLSIGDEEGKGNTLTRESHALLKNDASANYVGYVEGRGLFAGETDIVVCEGFTGNAILKLAEGLSSGLFQTIMRELAEVDPAAVEQFKPVMKRIYAKHDYHEYGGAPLLGAKGTCLICHGSSEARTITNAIRTGMQFQRLGVNDAIVEVLRASEAAMAARRESAGSPA